ncbi:transmembrane protein 198-like [Chanos chanos]|uniref:Transmembrane protein 198 n=1 Tax=Chanos chanos TaxID=29144 RepID=A0A6J2WA47_CHACN|nr:transmembrane protein 198-like [Chanos chanos]
MADPSTFVTEGVMPTAVEVDTCVLEIRRKYNVIPTLTCSVCFLVGIIYCFCGYRCFKLVMFLSGLLFGSEVGSLLCLREQLLDTPLDTETRLGISLGIGVLAGLVTVLVRCVGLFLTGLQLGLLLCVVPLLAVGQYYDLTPVWAPLGTVLGTSVFCAVLALLWQKALTVAATAVMGAALAVTCVDYWLETPLLVVRAYEGLRRTEQKPYCWYSWLIVGAWPVLALLGALVQWKLTARGLSHTKVIFRGRQKQVQLMKIRQRESRRRPEGTYRRRPPPLKRYAGDVLAPSYLQSLRERQMSTGSSQSSLSTVHHTMIDFDYETGSMVPLTSSASSAILRV